MKKIMVLHHNDADGFGAAFAAWYGLYLALPPDQDRPEMEFIPVQYGEPVPIEQLKAFAPDEVYILDFSYSRGILLALQAEFPFLVVIDHHKTAAEDLEGLPFVLFDMARSGCALSWLTFCKDLPMPAILGYVEDRDLWKFELPESKAVNAYIATLPFDLMEWLNFSMGSALAAGRAVLAFQAEQIRRRVKDALQIRFGRELEANQYAFYVPGDKSGPLVNLIAEVPCVNASDNISELGDALSTAFPEAPFTMSYCDRPDGKRSYSLRSRNGFDVSEVARAFGGGGHRSAAGWTASAPAVV